MHALAESFLAELDQIAAQDNRSSADAVVPRRFGELKEIEQQALAELLTELADRTPFPLDKQQLVLANFLENVARRFHPRQSSPPRETVTRSLRESLAALYVALPLTSMARPHLLAALSGSATPDDLSLLADLVASNPPHDSTAAVVAFSPLWQQRSFEPGPLFPRLLDGLAHRGCTGVILDLTNYLTRRGLSNTHPAAGRTEALADLLGSLAQQLGKLEESPAKDARDAAEKVSEAVALAVSLCDALALIGDKSVVGKLYQALELGHRRLRTEAAAALARMDEDAGRDALVQLAAEPVARLRVLSYAEELGLLDQIDDVYQTLEARAESELALSLAQPTFFGLPPTSCELIDRREQYWPGYDDPVDCFLFRFAYQLGDVSFSNIAIAGPLAHAFTADLADLPPDDIYAIYAGWQAEHEDIKELDVEQLDDFQRTDVVRLQRRLHDAKFESIVPRILGLFFGEKVLVADARRDGVPGHAIVDGSDMYWYPHKPTPRRLSSSDVYCIYKGKKLLRSFNP